MGFLKKAKKIAVDMTFKTECYEGNENQYKSDVQKILDSSTPEEITILRKVYEKPAIKNAALAHARILV